MDTLDAPEADIININFGGTIALSTEDIADIHLLPTLDEITINANNVTLKRDPPAFGRFFQVLNSTVRGITFDGGSILLTGGGILEYV